MPVVPVSGTGEAPPGPQLPVGAFSRLVPGSVQVSVGESALAAVIAAMVAMRATRRACAAILAGLER